MSADDTSALKTRLQEDSRTALRAGDKDRLGVLRMALAAVQQRELESKDPIDDGDVQKVIEKMVKQRTDAAEQFAKGGRQDLVDKENAEIACLEAYLPEPMSEAETAALIDEVIAELGVSSPKDMGRVMGELKRRGGGRIDLGRVSGVVRSRLQSDES